jgi:hypothetical protein
MRLPHLAAVHFGAVLLAVAITVEPVFGASPSPECEAAMNELAAIRRGHWLRLPDSDALFGQLTQSVAIRVDSSGSITYFNARAYGEAARACARANSRVATCDAEFLAVTPSRTQAGAAKRIVQHLRSAPVGVSLARRLRAVCAEHRFRIDIPFNEGSSIVVPPTTGSRSGDVAAFVNALCKGDRTRTSYTEVTDDGGLTWRLNAGVKWCQAPADSLAPGYRSQRPG